MNPLEANIAPQTLIGMIKKVGPEHCIFSTDYGQRFSPIAPVGFRMGMRALVELGMREQEISIMVKDNPRRLLDV